MPLNTEDKLWQQWKATGKEDDYDRLYQALTPVLNQHVNKFKSYGVDENVIHASAVKNLSKGIQSFSPTRGASLKTHVFNTMRRMNREVGEHQNFAHIPERRRLRIQTYNQVKEEIRERMGREATTQELADALGWSMAEVGKMDKEMRGQVSEATNEALSQFGFVRPGARAQAALDYVYHELDPQEKLVFEHLYGYGNKPILKTNREIAGKARCSETQVRNIRQRIAGKMRPFLGTE